MGFEKDRIVIIDDINAVGDKAHIFKEEVKRIGAVVHVSLSSFLPAPSSRNGTTLFADGALEGENAVIIGSWSIDYDYISTLGLDIIAGRDFDKQLVTDSTAIILNESALELFGIEAEAAIGMRLTDDIHRQDKENMVYKTVIGVVKNFHFESLRNGIDGLSLQLGGNANRMMVKLNSDDLGKSMERIEAMWNIVAPNQPFRYIFMDDSFNETYKEEQRLGRIFIAFTLLSILIACLGLFGLAAFNAEKRSKEIGIRKVLGASVRQISFKLSIDFLKLVGVSIIIALPLAWYAMNMWLEDFTYRIEIAWWILGFAALLAVIISILTVSYQSMKAALSNPVNSLRSE